MPKTDQDIVVMQPSRVITEISEFDSLKAWLDINCPEAMQIPFNSEFIKAYDSEFVDNSRNKFPIWVGFDYQHEALLFKLTWG